MTEQKQNTNVLSEPQTIFALIGGALFVVSVFLPWVGSLGGYNLIKAAGGSLESKILALSVWLIPLAGVVTAVIHYTNYKGRSWVALVSAFISLFIVVMFLISASSDLPLQASVFDIIGISPYLVFGGTLCMAVSIENEKSPFDNINTGGARMTEQKQNTNVLSEPQTILALIGGALFVVSVFLPWVDIGGFIKLSGYNLVKYADGADKLLAMAVWLIPIAGAVTAYFHYTNHNSKKGIAIGSAVLSLLIISLFLISVKKELPSEAGILDLAGVGLYMVVGGIVCMAISAAKDKSGSK